MKVKCFISWFVLLAWTVSLWAGNWSVVPGQDIQSAIDQASRDGGGTIILEAGIHTITVPIQLKSNITLQGQPDLTAHISTSEDIKMIVAAHEGLVNLSLQNLLITGTNSAHSGGIEIVSYRKEHNTIKLYNVHVFHTGWGVHIKGAVNVSIKQCNFSQNGNIGMMRYAHNLYLRRCHSVSVVQGIFNDSISGNGINISYSSDISIIDCQTVGNNFRGIRAADTHGFRVHNCIIANNGEMGLVANKEIEYTQNIDWDSNCVSNNGKRGLYARTGVTGRCTNNNAYNNHPDYSLSRSIIQSGNISDASQSCTSILNTQNQAPPLRIFVSPHGNDSFSGRLAGTISRKHDGPLRTLEAARDVVRHLSPQQRREPVEICLEGGRYHLQRPFVLEPRDSGSKHAPVIYRSWDGQPVIISGGIEVRNWSRTTLNNRQVWVSDLGRLKHKIPSFEQLWVNGRRAVQARTPNRGCLKIQSVPTDSKSTLLSGGKTGVKPGFQFTCYPADMPALVDISEGVAVVFNKWLEYHMPLQKIDPPSRTIICTKKSLRPLEKDDLFYFEGGRAMLDQPGEWYFDRKTNKLYYLPYEDETEIEAVIPVLNNVLRLEGDAANSQWVQYIQFRGLTFSHTTWNLSRDFGPSGYRQADIEMEGSLYLVGARHCRFESCEVTAVGNYAIQIGPGSSDNKILNCKIHDLGAGGLMMGPKIRPQSSRDYVPEKDYPPVLSDPSDACSRNEVADCRIYDGGRYYHCAVGIWIGQSPDNYIHHNEIRDFYYSGISCGWTWGYGRGLACNNRFEFNLIHHIGQRTQGDGPFLSDMGGIYTLGDQAGTIIRNNVFHDIQAAKYGGWAIYFDEGTRNILAENNLVYRCRHSCFDQHYGKDNIIRNNIFAFADTSIIMLARSQPHSQFNLTHNILLSNGTPIYAGGYGFKVNTPKAFQSDYNLVWSVAGPVIGAQDRFASRVYEPDQPVLSWSQWQALGYDQHSVIADPGFGDPASGDFQLPDNSPALKLGFQPFDYTLAGPRPRQSQTTRVLPAETD